MSPFLTWMIILASSTTLGTGILPEWARKVASVADSCWILLPSDAEDLEGLPFDGCLAELSLVGFSLDEEDLELSLEPIVEVDTRPASVIVKL